MKILDTTVVIAFYRELNNPGLLLAWRRLDHELSIPKAVQTEITDPVTTKNMASDLRENNLSIIDNITSEEIKGFNRRYPRLHDGEISVILHALKENENERKCYCVLDDGLARKVAKENKLKICGTIGLLRMLKTKGKLNDSEFNAAMTTLQNSSFRASKTLFSVPKKI